jgi:hypothetical protein
MSKPKLMAMMSGAVLLAGAAALAGTKSTNYPWISNYSDGSGYATGSIAAARASTGTYTEIYCYSYPTYATCSAWVDTPNNRYFGCTTQDPTLLTIIRSVPSDASITFMGDGTGNCTSVSFSNSSANLPKTP